MLAASSIALTVPYAKNLTTGCVWHAVQADDGSWGQFAQTSIKGLISFDPGPLQQNAPGRFEAGTVAGVSQVALAASNSTLHAASLSAGGITHYTIDSSATFSAGDYNNNGLYPGGNMVTAMTMCAVAGECHFVALTDGGGL